MRLLAGLNRTFMELKYEHFSINPNVFLRLNRTFMELKLVSYGRTLQKLLCVLIEPLWNWNNLDTQKVRFIGAVLIEPLWNWNTAPESVAPNS